MKKLTDKQVEVLRRAAEFIKTKGGARLSDSVLGIIASLNPPEKSKQRPAVHVVPLVYCASHQDGDCYHPLCPQLRDNEPYATGRHCPLDVDRSE